MMHGSPTREVSSYHVLNFETERFRVSHSKKIRHFRVASIHTCDLRQTILNYLSYMCFDASKIFLRICLEHHIRQMMNSEITKKAIEFTVGQTKTGKTYWRNESAYGEKCQGLGV